MFVGKRQIAVGDPEMNVAATVAHSQIAIDDVCTDIFAFHPFHEDLAVIQIETRDLYGAGNDQDVIDAASPVHDSFLFLRHYTGGDGDGPALSLNADNDVLELLFIHSLFGGLEPEIRRVGAANRNGSAEIADGEARRRIDFVN